MFEQPPNKRENVSPGYESVFSLGQKPYDQTFFLFLEKVSLSSISGQKDFVTLSNFASLSSLASLGTALLDNCSTLSFFPTISESKTFSRKKNSFFTSVLSLGHTFLGRGNIYSGASTKEDTRHTKVDKSN